MKIKYLSLPHLFHFQENLNLLLEYDYYKKEKKLQEFLNIIPRENDTNKPYPIETIKIALESDEWMPNLIHWRDQPTEVGDKTFTLKNGKLQPE